MMVHFIAQVLGFKGEQSQANNTAEGDAFEQNFIPAQTLSAAEFDQLLKDKGLVP